MAKAIPAPGGWLELVPGRAFTDQDGTQYPANWLDLASADDLAAIGAADIIEPPEPPEGKVNRITGLADENGVPVRTYEVEDVPVYVEPVPVSISDRQFAQGLWKQNVITFDEAKAFVKTGDLPEALHDLILTLPAEMREDAEIVISGATEFRRDHPLVAPMAAAFGWTDEVADEFWRYSSGL